MTVHGLGYSDPARRVQHPYAVLAGVASSLAIHAGLLLLLSGVRFQVGNLIDDPARKHKEKQTAVKEIRIKPDPAQLAMRTVVLAGKPAQDAAVTVDIPKEAEVKGVAPEVVAIEPPPMARDRLAGDSTSVAEPVAAPERMKWEPRQEIVEIDRKVIDDKINSFARKPIPKVDRVRAAPDMALPVDRSKLAPFSSAGIAPDKVPSPDIDRRIEGGLAGLAGGRTGIDGLRSGGAGGGVKPVKMSDTPLFTRGSSTNSYKPIEKYLKAELTLYTSMFEPEYGYCKIEISRLGDEILPVIPKDVIFVQDCSASLAEQRLHFCRDGLTNSFDDLGPNDRFNVISFREAPDMCFKEWAAVTPGNIALAKAYVAGMKSTGDTDIYRSLKYLMETKPVPGRPVIALVISDGYSTAGIVDSSDIIGEFSKLNSGSISVFALGVSSMANMYLLDLVSYCNRGDASNVESGRWGIPESVHNLVQEVKRPVLSDVRFTFSGGGRCEVFPVMTSNLYLDRPLVLYGRYKRDLPNLVFQAVGKAGDIDCDMVFDLDISKAGRPGGAEIRTAWAQQKIYHLMGQYAATGDLAAVREIKELSKQYKIKVPYARELPR